jgi:transcriptional regulator of acetoin/glycerol metabolism
MATSWRRCLTAHHLDPEFQAASHIITEKEIKDSRELLRNLILHAQEELDRLYAIVGPQQYVVLLCDSDGVAIHHRGKDSMADAYKNSGIWLGGVWSEQIEGTNGIGTCITNQRATMVLRGQHFRTRHSNLSCAGAPISTHWAGWLRCWIHHRWTLRQPSSPSLWSWLPQKCLPGVQRSEYSASISDMRGTLQPLLVGVVM